MTCFYKYHITSNDGRIIHWWVGKITGLNVIGFFENTEDKTAWPNRITWVDGKEDCQDAATVR